MNAHGGQGKGGGEGREEVMLAILAESALRSLVLGSAVWVGLHLLRIRNPHVHMTSWAMVLVGYETVMTSPPVKNGLRSCRCGDIISMRQVSRQSGGTVTRSCLTT